MIRGVSGSIATTVAESFGDSLVDFMKQFTTNAAQLQETLTQLKLSNQKRRLGPALAKRIMDYFQTPTEKAPDENPGDADAT